MEYFWYVIAALGAGVTTGLVGLSAAVVMVPILIVLCPAFGGDPYQATAIALASDVIASIVSSIIYIKHKNIDLKRCWLVMLCVIVMSIVGSIVASFIHQTPMSWITLVMCVFIGLRFIVQPDPKSKRLVPKGTRLDKKGIIISVIFGIAIGFIVGFVGSGGGLMMLLVFTLFLGMERKAAVGTSTLTMAVTALIAFTSHTVIEPQILFEHWDALIICSLVATLGSIVAAQFANKVNGKVVGIATGVILVALGIVLIILNFFVLN